MSRKASSIWRKSENVTATAYSLITNPGVFVTTPIRVDSGASVTVLSTDFTVVCTNVAARAVTLFTPTTDLTINIKDGAGTATTANITITCTGADLFEDGSASRILDDNYGSLTLHFDAGSSRWYSV